MFWMLTLENLIAGFRPCIFCLNIMFSLMKNILKIILIVCLIPFFNLLLLSLVHVNTFLVHLFIILLFLIKKMIISDFISLNTECLLPG